MFECEKCKKKFKYQSDYDRHLNKKSPCGEKSQYNLGKRTCKYCNKAFARADSLSRHMKGKCKDKINKDSEDNNQKNINSRYQNEITELRKEIENLKNGNQIAEFKREIETLKKGNEDVELLKSNINELKDYLEEIRYIANDVQKYVYALNTGQADKHVNPIYKCGRMTGSIAKILTRYGTYYPNPVLEYVHEVKNDKLIEYKLFEQLKQYKLNVKREFLICDIKLIMDTFRDIILEFD
jgi:hypothetical protein